MLYLLFVEHVVGSDIVNKFKSTKDGQSCYYAFDAHIRNALFLENKATSATNSLHNAVYKGEQQFFIHIGNL